MARLPSHNSYSHDFATYTINPAASGGGGDTLAGPNGRIATEDG
jgi:hypothetical protein